MTKPETSPGNTLGVAEDEPGVRQDAEKWQKDRGPLLEEPVTPAKPSKPGHEPGRRPVKQENATN